MAKRSRVRRDWPGLLLAQAASGLSVAAFCRQEGVCTSQFYRWRRRGPAADAGRAHAGFVELHPVDPRSSGSGVALVLDGGWRLELEPGFDPPTLERVLACVARRAGCWR